MLSRVEWIKKFRNSVLTTPVGVCAGSITRKGSNKAMGNSASSDGP